MSITQGIAMGADGRTIYVMNMVPGSPAMTLPDPVPGTSRVIATGTVPDQGHQYGVVLENGDAYRGAPAAWEYVGNLVNTPTPATRESFGALKSRYRQQGAAQPETQDH